MNKIRKLLICVSLITGMTLGFYLYHPTDSSDDLSSSHVFDDTVRFANDNLTELIRKDLKTFLLINDIVESSPYLKKRKKAFLTKYYGQKSASDFAQKERLLRMVLTSQQKQH
jgi:hypothetical protein